MFDELQDAHTLFNLCKRPSRCFDRSLCEGCFSPALRRNFIIISTLRSVCSVLTHILSTVGAECTLLIDNKLRKLKCIV